MSLFKSHANIVKGIYASNIRFINKIIFYYEIIVEIIDKSKKIYYM